MLVTVCADNDGDDDWSFDKGMRTKQFKSNPSLNQIQGVFFTGPPPKSSKYEQVNLG